MKKKKTTSETGSAIEVRARLAADKRRKPAETLTRSEALAEAPWLASMPAAWEGAFRAAYADRLTELGAAAPRPRQGTSSKTGGKTKLERRLLSQTAEEFGEQDAQAEAAGLSWSTWARRKLAT